VVRVPGCGTEIYCFLWGTNWIYICYVEESRPLLWSSGQSSWLQIQMSGFDSRRYQIFWEVVGLERGPLSLLSTTEELLQRKSSGSGLESLEYGRRDLSRWPRGTLYPWKVVLTSPTSSCCSGGRFRSRTQATEFVCACISIVPKRNAMVWVLERTIPIERQPLVDEVIANFLRIEGATWSAWRMPTAVFSVF
jgi:hypothetical protein